MRRRSFLLSLRYLVPFMLAFSGAPSSSAEISKSAYIDLWTRTCKMGSTTHNINLPPAELALMRPEVENMQLVDSMMYGNYQTMKSLGARVPSYAAFAEQKCHCVAEYIVAHKSILTKPTPSSLVFDAAMECISG